MTTRSIPMTMLALAVIGLAVACGTTEGVAGPPPTAPAGGAVIVAAGMAFDRAEISVPAGEPFQLVFENRDSAPHNVSVMNAAGQSIFVGEIFGGSASRTYQVPAIPAGTYPFRCDVHTDMAGTLIVAAPAPEPAVAPAPVNPAASAPALGGRSDPR